MDEKSIEIVKRFSESWVKTYDFYDMLINKYTGWDKLRPIQHFISERINTGQDKFYRAGTSLYTLVLSRSVEFGLRDDQKYLSIEAIAENDFKIMLCDKFNKYREYRIQDLNDERLMNLMKTLKNTLVD